MCKKKAKMVSGKRERERERAGKLFCQRQT